MFNVINMKVSGGVKIFVSAFLFLLISIGTNAQCAMCRASLENNVSNGNIGIAAGINFGIMYLFVAPYAVIGLISFFWYRASKKNSRNEFLKRPVAR